MESIPPQAFVTQSLTSAEANQRLVSDLEDFLCSPQWISFRHIICTRFAEVMNCFYLFFAIFIFLASLFDDEITTFVGALHIVEMLIIFIVLLFRITILVVDIRVHTFWYKERCMSTVVGFIKKGGCTWTHESYPSQPMSTLRSQVTVPGLRDNHIVNIPLTLLVCGDIIQLDFSHPSPANVKIIKPQFHHSDILLPEELNAGQLPHIRYKKESDSISFKESVKAWYKVTQTPFLRRLAQVNLFSHPLSHLSRQKVTVEWFINVFLVPFTFFLTLSFNIIRSLFFPEYFHWSDMYLVWPTLTILPLISLCLPLLWTLSNVYGLLQLEWCFEGYYKAGVCSFSVLLSVLKAILMPYSHLKYSTLHSFGIVSAVCAVDKEFILTSGFPTPEKVFFFRSTPANEKDGKSALDDRNDLNSTRIEVIPEILDLTPTSAKESGLTFDDPNWQEYIASLKPIGLNVAITSHAFGNLSVVSPPVSFGFQTFFDKTQCCCSLAHEIGVSRYAKNNLNFKSSIIVLAHDNSENFMPTISDNSLVKAKSRSFFQKVQSDIQSHMLAILCSDQFHNSILMSSGSADFISKYCCDYWDGQDLQPLSNNEVAAIHDFFTRRSLSSYCIALSYNPLYNNSIPFKGNIGISVPHHVIDRPIHHYSSSESELIMDNATHVLNSLCNQVFVGMVSLQYYPKSDIVSLVQDLRNSGIRFIHFTAENEVKGKIFAEKLGLEAGWNCHISLSPFCDEEYEFDNESLSSNASSFTSVFNLTQAYIKAKLPKGVENVRSHLKNVDNVPLLVPLFTDCSPDAVEEMFKIMQENGEVVLCIGNAAVVDNLSLFKHADIGLSILPAGSDLKEFDCSMHPNANDDSDASSPMRIAASLNSMTCELQIQRNADVSLHATIIKARHWLGSIQKCLLFACGASIASSCFLVLSVLLFLPLPLSSSHMFWFLLFNVPVVSLSLLFNKMDNEMEMLMPDRTVPAGIKDIQQFVVYFVITYFPAAVVSLLLFNLSLDGLCHAQSGFTCNFILGNTNSSQGFQLGWRGLNYQGYTLAQDCTIFFFTLYVMTSSLMFIHHSKPIWKLYKYINWPYIVSLVVVLAFELCYLVVSQVITRYGVDNNGIVWSVSAVPSYFWVIGIIWLLLQLVLQESVKYRIRKKFIHSQRKLRLSFQTKLGMNSPF
ncbi:PREDICTED: transmembrane protein 94-like [Amphimedon queenslandica]|uniref:Cation-transporting P-type ATPase C-terminal domain-containing protein n=1 Tax=Amphimedon queenslandica TaxID=400682 RepID=A0A1X7VRU5_AMPQE|nr:PREDICTED: transmembrane protein 94-like [Amphimedon queenslandica]|eukprot:XP_019854507.1 PREDICTED: transmembrane protein 94-like [Amphimedon queenslandica]